MPFSLKHWKRLQGLGDVKTDIHTACINKRWKTVVKLLQETTNKEQAFTTIARIKKILPNTLTKVIGNFMYDKPIDLVAQEARDARIELLNSKGEIMEKWNRERAAHAVMLADWNQAARVLFND